ncbi:MAG: hypothetical protein CVU98_02910 [Firmicutes bacterium HGW-Firmicutes-3]|jgi:type I restriction enzyme S subunit|nr:MAG: hypothetical protein CVU98_02910 [Firmicutes bacterium HGW-Firmicutes-3]
MNKNRRLINEMLFFQEGPGVRNAQYTSEGVKLINVANLANGQVDLSKSERYISEEEAYGKYKHFLVDEGDFVIASSGIKVDYFDKKMGFIHAKHLPLCMNTSTIRFKSLDHNILNIRYFMYFMKSNDFKRQLMKEITGSAQLNFGPSHLNRMTFPVVEIDQQIEIHTILDKITLIIQKRTLQLEELDHLINSRFVEMFGDPITNRMGWKVCSFNSSSVKISDGPFGSNLKSEHYCDEGIRVIRLQNIGVGDFIDRDKAFVNTEHYEMISKYTCYPGELVIATMGTPNLRATIVPDYLEKAIHKADCVRFVPKPDILNSTFACYYINRPETLLLASDKMHGQTRTRISSGQVKQLPIFLPPVELQKQFDEFVQHVNKLKSKVEKSLTEKQMLFDSLMQEYFE